MSSAKCCPFRLGLNVLIWIAKVNTKAAYWSITSITSRLHVGPMNLSGYFMKGIRWIMLQKHERRTNERV